MKEFIKKITTVISSVLISGGVSAHDIGSAGLPVCLEANFMMADAMNNNPPVFAPFATANGPGRVVEMNIFTGKRGITVNTPFNPGNSGSAVCPEGVACPGPWKPTGVLSGGMNGHAFISSAAQHALTELHRDGTPIRTVKLPMDDDPRFGTVPRLLGSQMMPNGNIIQNVCDANFFNAVNSDQEAGFNDPLGGSNDSFKYFPPVYSTTARAQNSRMLVVDQETLEVIDEFSAPDDPRWTCMAGIAFTDEGMFVSMFHGSAVFVIDWKAGVEKESCGVGCNKGSTDDDVKKGHHREKMHDEYDDDDLFKFGKRKNVAKVIRVIDFLGHDADLNDPNRRDSLRAITFDEGGNLYATNRVRSKACVKGEAGCNPSVFRQRIDIVPFGEDHPTRTIALDPGVNVIAGIRTNRMSGPGCDYVTAEAIANGESTDNVCDVETLLVAASAMNPGCDKNNDGVPGPGHPANRCFVPGGYVAEYRIDLDHVDGATGSCSGNPNDGWGAGEGNEGCALPIATFFGEVNGEDNMDPRMLMTIHEAFIQ
ncbi:MAG: hypothetical protein DIZ80_09540 [endosymbiont of Galathealinum brachiosum]|uniref:Uncharacterized protein n=1 Tax=endosymbiont of Galathealinum brachiosum TaxID=2200906 RepID=A0A370DC85_9GAMM|nr:MAG: hypothetical protein DIZ80_09540 [endosymbiont of Galathealinum brachiosum]